MAVCSRDVETVVRDRCFGSSIKHDHRTFMIAYYTRWFSMKSVPFQLPVYANQCTLLNIEFCTTIFVIIRTLIRTKHVVTIKICVGSSQRSQLDG